MKTWVRHTLLTLAAAAFATACFFAYRSGERARSGLYCAKLNVIVSDSTRLGFVGENEIMDAIETGYGEFMGRKLDSLDMIGIEEAVLAHSAVRTCDAYVTRDSALNVVVSQRRPVIRFVAGEEGFYIDDIGLEMPLQQAFTADVPTFEGILPKDPVWIQRAIALTTFIKESKVWKPEYFTLTADGNGDITLIPARGSEKILFGQPCNVGNKFKMLEHYYSTVLPAKGDGYYSTVNLKFDGQLVCRK